VTADDFNALFDRFGQTVVRLEALPAYDIADEVESFAAWSRGDPRPERSVRTSPWVARIAVSTVTQSKRWQRVRVVSDPPTEYERYELVSYVESQAVGEEILIARRDAALNAVGGDLGSDVWLFDTGLRDAFAAVMRYDPSGRWEGVEHVTAPGALAGFAEHIARVREVAEPLNTYLARSRVIA
jgi:hypothetical protein